MPIIGNGGITVTREGKVWIVSGSSSATRFSDMETPEGLVNGSNKDFTLANFPNPASSLMIHVNGLLQQGGGNDYSSNGNAVHFTTAPLEGSSIVASYRY